MSNRLDPLTSTRDVETLARSIENHLACPHCHDPVTVRAAEIRRSRSRCEFTGAIADGIAVMRRQRDGSFFGDKHEVMEHGSAESGVRRCCYARGAA